MPPWLRRCLMLAAVVIAILALGFVAPKAEAETRLLADQAGEQTYRRSLLAAITSAQHRIHAGMYLIRRTDNGVIDELCEALVAAQQRGVDVRLFVDSGDGERYAYTREASAWLRERGVAVIDDELKRTSHMKMFLIDDQVFIGSHNWTGYAMTRNREASILSSDPRLIAEVEAWFAQIPAWDDLGKPPSTTP